MAALNHSSSFFINCCFVSFIFFRTCLQLLSLQPTRAFEAEKSSLFVRRFPMLWPTTPARPSRTSLSWRERRTMTSSNPPTSDYQRRWNRCLRHAFRNQWTRKITSSSFTPPEVPAHPKVLLTVRPATFCTRGSPTSTCSAITTPTTFSDVWPTSVGSQDTLMLSMDLLLMAEQAFW